MRDGALAPEPALLSLLAARIEAGTGLHYPPAKQRELAGALGRMAAAKGLAGARECADWLLAGQWDAARTALCARFLTIGETYFFREPRALELVCGIARERLATGASAPLRLWSAGCCTGEEPYSIAMALREQVPRFDPARVSILATDLNEAFLDFARAGEYRRWSFRRTSPALQRAHFEPAAGARLRIAGHLRAQVQFAQLNLALPEYPSAATRDMDVIFCRNVLMYFSRPRMKQVVARLRECLADGGWLVVNPSEASSELFEGFAAVCFPDAVFFRKLHADECARPARAAPPREAACAAPLPRPQRIRAPASRAAAVRMPARPARAPAAQAAEAPAGALPALARAAELAQSGRPDAALQCLRRAGEADPLAAELHHATALLALELGEHALARQCLKRLLYLQPESALGHYLYALAEQAAGQAAGARRLLERCAALLAGAPAEDAVPGADGWQVAGLRESVRTWLERVQ